MTHQALVARLEGSGDYGQEASVPSEQTVKPAGQSDEASMTVWLVPDPVNGGLHIRQWSSDGLEPGAHLLVPACLANRNEHDLLRALEQVMGWIDNWDPNFIHDDEWPETAHDVRAIIARAKGEPR